MNGTKLSVFHVLFSFFPDAPKEQSVFIMLNGEESELCFINLANPKVSVSTSLHKLYFVCFTWFIFNSFFSFCLKRIISVLENTLIFTYTCVHSRRTPKHVHNRICFRPGFIFNTGNSYMSYFLTTKSIVAWYTTTGCWISNIEICLIDTAGFDDIDISRLGP